MSWEAVGGVFNNVVSVTTTSDTDADLRNLEITVCSEVCTEANRKILTFYENRRLFEIVPQGPNAEHTLAEDIMQNSDSHVTLGVVGAMRDRAIVVLHKPTDVLAVAIESRHASIVRVVIESALEQVQDEVKLKYR